jgi:hypothetical protein
MGIGGFNRTEIYQDPWTKTVYISGHGDGGPYKNNEHHGGIIFASQNNGQTWSTLHKFEDQGKRRPRPTR